MVPLAQNGRMVAERDMITLYESRDRVIVQAPVRQVRAYRMHSPWPGFG